MYSPACICIFVFPIIVRNICCFQFLFSLQVSIVSASGGTAVATLTVSLLVNYPLFCLLTVFCLLMFF